METYPSISKLYGVGKESLVKAREMRRGLEMFNWNIFKATKPYVTLVASSKISIEKT